MTNSASIESKTKAIRQFYDRWSKGDFAHAFESCDPKATFQISGKSQLAGKFDASNFASGYGAHLRELSGGSYSLEVHDILVSDRHAVALGTVKLQRGGKPAEYRTAHVWRFEGDQPLAGYEYFRDQYQVDGLWT
jgi:ketosteroid isomerase-like protein